MAPPKITRDHALARSTLAGPGSYVELWLDHVKVGCGWRRYLVLRAGPKWIRLLCTENAEPLTVPRVDFVPKPLPINKARVSRLLRATSKAYGLDRSEPVLVALRMLRIPTAKAKK